MSCDVGEVMERLENELCSFTNLFVTSPTSQLIRQPFHRFTHITAHFPTLPLLHLRHSSFSNPYFASPTSQALHLIHLASRPWFPFCFVHVVLLISLEIGLMRKKITSVDLFYNGVILFSKIFYVFDVVYVKSNSITC